MSLEFSATRTIPWPRPLGCPSQFETLQVFTGSDDGDLALEIGIAKWGGAEAPSREAFLKLHKDRAGQGINPVVILAMAGEKAWLFGPNSQAAVVGPLAIDHVQRLLQSALNEPSGLDARRSLNQTYEAISATSTGGSDSDALRGVGNAGLFATHELRHGVRSRSDWNDACVKSKELMSLRKDELVKKLGYSLEDVGGHASLLKSSGANPRAVAVVLLDNETFDGQSNRFSVSPVAFGLQIAERREVAWLIVLRKDAIRLYPARLDLGVGRKGLAETYFELNLSVADESTAGFLSLVFSSEALADNGSCYEILRSSAQYAVGLSERLRDNVYGEIVPHLALSVASQLPKLGVAMDREGLNLAYQITLRIFFRMLFQAYADDRKLLPFGENDDYTKNAIKGFAKKFVEQDDIEFDDEATSYWDDLIQVWHAIDTGSKRFGIPAYNGGLFSSDGELQPEGALIERLRITDDVMGPVLRALLIDTGDDGNVGPIDFRSLSVREFGTIYEGLLESNLGVADTDLVLDDDDTWVPATKGVRLEAGRSAKKGTVYFHDTSGARKGTGSYFTPSFVVEHLLERSLDPALDAHLERVKIVLEKGDQVGAADLFFDFKVADLAMGSAHFLTAAIDHIEQRMAGFLDSHPIPGVTNELRRLEDAARDKLGENASVPEPSSLLRRQIARRCIYGLDINPVAVELARVSIWIHTFVRGLPMSSLDHTLVCANSLTGVGTVEEALNVLVPGRRDKQPTFFDDEIEGALSKVRDTLVEIAKGSELDSRESKAASRASIKAYKDAENAKLLFDAVVLTRIGRVNFSSGTRSELIIKTSRELENQDALVPLRPAHMPLLFPEVFLRDIGGFDVLIGNPPWDKLRYEATQFWALKFPGLLTMENRDERIDELRRNFPLFVAEENLEIENRELLHLSLKTQFELQGSGHHDLSKYFAERNLVLLGASGVLGVVLPGSFSSLGGWSLIRKGYLDSGALNITQSENIRGFLFPHVHFQTSVVTVALKKGQMKRVLLQPGMNSRESFENVKSIDVTELIDNEAEAQVPWLGSETAARIFSMIAQFPTLGSGGAWISGDPDTRWDFSGSGKHKNFSSPKTDGRSWSVLMTRHIEPFQIAVDGIRKFVSEKDLRDLVQRGELQGVPEVSLPDSHPPIVYRFPSSSTNTRTLIAALLPKIGYFYSTGYAHGIRINSENDENDVLALLAIMNSIPLDWWARRIVDRHVGSRVIRKMPIPLLDRSERIELAGLAKTCLLTECPSEIYTQYAKFGTVDPSNLAKEEALAKIDAIVCNGLGFLSNDIAEVFESFHRNWKFETRLALVLRIFGDLKGYV